MGLAGSQLGCWSEADGETVRRSPSAEAPKNCLFIILDAGAAGHFSTWGYGRRTTPNIDALSNEGFVFRKAFSQASATVPSVRSYFIGKYPDEARVHLEPAEATLAEAFRKQGFKTALFSENPYITPAFKYDKGFDSSVSYFSHQALLKSQQEQSDVDLESEKMHGDVREWISGSDGSPWFCYVHHLRPHAPYHAPDAYSTRFSKGLPQGRANGSAHTLKSLETTSSPKEARYFAALYDGNLSYCDHLIGQLLDWLATTKRLEETLVIIASDHGEAFMQHGFLQHGTTTYDEMIHVPLIFRFPTTSGLAKGESMAQVEMVDLFPTLASLYRFSDLPKFDGKSLLPLLTGATQTHKEYVFTLSPRHRHYTYAVRTAKQKYILNLDPRGKEVQSRELYDLEIDSMERTNLIQGGAANEDLEMLLAARFPNLLGSAESVILPSLESQGIDAHTRDALEALGYIE
jgi:arylsulfatase